MPRCEGLPGGPCPLKKNDATVVVGKGDLMLCPACDSERRRLWDEGNKSKSKASAKTASTSKSVTPAGDGGQQQRGGAGLTTSTTTQHPAVTESHLAAGYDGQSDSCLADARAIESTVSASKFVVNEMLAYLQFYRDKSTADALHGIAMMFFTSNETAEAKQRLIDLFPLELVDCPLKVGRRHSATRSAHDAEIEDIIRMLELLDNMNVLNKVSFVACNLDRLPKYGPEEVNVCTIADKQMRLDNKIVELTNQLNTVVCGDGPVNAVKQIDDQMVKMTNSLQEQLNRFTAACAEVTESLRRTGRLSASTATTSGGSGTAAAVRSSPVDRSRNVVITGIEENRDSDVWHLSRSVSRGGP